MMKGALKDTIYLKQLNCVDRVRIIFDTLGITREDVLLISTPPQCARSFEALYLNKVNQVGPLYGALVDKYLEEHREEA